MHALMKSLRQIHTRNVRGRGTSKRETRLLKIASLSFEAFNLRNGPIEKNKHSLPIFVLYFAGKDTHLALRLWSESMPLCNFNSQRPIAFVTPHFEADS